VKLNTRLADSLILAIVNLCLCLSGFLFRYTSHSEWLIAVCWVLLPPLLVITLFFWGRDLAKATTRKQAIVALFLSMPLLALEVWFFKNLKL
jgi:RsiW-degrading membrane proteinase PrsW (M82 family)